jgi:hypothetical protein
MKATAKECFLKTNLATPNQVLKTSPWEYLDLSGMWVGVDVGMDIKKRTCVYKRLD